MRRPNCEPCWSCGYDAESRLGEGKIEKLIEVLDRAEVECGQSEVDERPMQGIKKYERDVIPRRHRSKRRKAQRVQRKADK